MERRTSSEISGLPVAMMAQSRPEPARHQGERIIKPVFQPGASISSTVASTAILGYSVQDT